MRFKHSFILGILTLVSAVTLISFLSGYLFLQHAQNDVAIDTRVSPTKPLSQFEVGSSSKIDRDETASPVVDQTAQPSSQTVTETSSLSPQPESKIPSVVAIPPAGSLNSNLGVQRAHESVVVDSEAILSTQSPITPSHDAPTVVNDETITVTASEHARDAINGLESDETHLSLSGRTYDAESAAPLRDIVVKLSKIAATESDKGMSVKSNDLGHFNFLRLSPGDYQLTTIATSVYPAQTIMVRAGFGAAHIGLRRTVTVEVSGAITNQIGNGIGGATISGLNGVGKTMTDGSGRYRLKLSLAGKTAFSLNVSKPGFIGSRQQIDASAIKTGARITQNFSLVPAGRATIKGQVTNDRGEPVSGATLSFQSDLIDARYNVASDRQGRFMISGVRAANDYVLLARGGGRYKSASINNLEVAGSDNSVSIELESLGSASLSGVVTNTEGSPITDLNLLAVSSADGGSSKQLTTDQYGRFDIEQITPGAISLSTRTEPRFIINGLTLVDYDDVDIDVIVDQGQYSIAGVVSGPGNGPISSANVSLHWEHNLGEIKSIANRSVKSDADGQFVFDRLGPGPHKLSIRVDGFQRYELSVDPQRQHGPAIVQLTQK